MKKLKCEDWNICQNYLKESRRQDEIFCLECRIRKGLYFTESEIWK